MGQENVDFKEYVQVEQKEGEDGLSLDLDSLYMENSDDLILKLSNAISEFSPNIQAIANLEGFNRGEIDIPEAELDGYVKQKKDLLNGAIAAFLEDQDANYDNFVAAIEGLSSSSLRNEIQDIVDGKGFQNNTLFGKLAAYIGDDYIKTGNDYLNNQDYEIEKIFNDQ